MKRFLFILVAFCILCGCNKDDDKGIANVPNSQTDKPDTPENVPESPNGDWSTEKTGNFIDAFIGTGMTLDWLIMIGVQRHLQSLLEVTMLAITI